MHNYLECAFSFCGLEDQYDGNRYHWQAVITWKCPVCGRRNRQVKNGVEKPGDKMPLPQEVLCKNKHTSQVVPHYWDERPSYGR